MTDARLLDGYLSESEFAEAIGKTVRTLQRWRTLRIGPPYTKAGEKTIIYNIESARKYLAAREYQPVREPSLQEKQGSPRSAPVREKTVRRRRHVTPAVAAE